MNKLQQWYYYKLLKCSPVRTEKYTIPLKIVGSGWGYGKTYWYEEDETLRNYRAMVAKFDKETESLVHWD